MGFFYISAPYLQKSRDATIREIREVVLRKNTAEGRQVTMQRNKFKLANLDTLMFVNDKLLKMENALESFLKKIDKQYVDLQEKQTHDWFIKGWDKEYPLQKFLYEFRWNDAKYPRNYTIQRIAETFEVKLNNFENELRQKTNTYNEVRVALSQNSQKEGNFYVKDLTDILIEPQVSPSDFKSTKYMTTMVVIVPVSNEADFRREADLLTNYVIPESAMKLKIPEKDGLALWKINLFRVKIDQGKDDDEDEGEEIIQKKDKKNQTPVQEFVERARDKMKAVAKEFKFESGLADTRRKRKEGLEGKLKAQSKAVSDICLAYFSEVFELYVHAKMLRLVIETNMRFGSDSTVIYLLESMPGREKNVQTMLIDVFGDKENEGLYGTKDEIDDGEDFFPFIYIPMLTL